MKQIFLQPGCKYVVEYKDSYRKGLLDYITVEAGSLSIILHLSDHVGNFVVDLDNRDDVVGILME